MNIPRSADGLINHHGAIPEDELWIKLGGDKGRGSFKFNFQLVNTLHPNSVKKTVLVSVFKAGDSASNLHTAKSTMSSCADFMDSVVPVVCLPYKL